MCKPKQFNGRNYNARMLCTQLGYFIECLNEHQIITFEQVQENIVENECITAYNQAIDVFNELLKEQFENDEPKDLPVFHLCFEEIRQQTLEHYLEIATMKDQYIFLVEYKMKLYKFMEEKEKLALDLNEKIIDQYNENVYKQISLNIHQECGNRQNQPFSFYQKIFNNLYEQFEAKAYGEKKMEIFMELMLKDSFNFHENLLLKIAQSGFEGMDLKLATQQQKLKSLEGSLGNTSQRKNELKSMQNKQQESINQIKMELRQSEQIIIQKQKQIEEIEKINGENYKIINQSNNENKQLEQEKKKLELEINQRKQNELKLNQDQESVQQAIALEKNKKPKGCM